MRQKSEPSGTAEQHVRAGALCAAKQGQHLFLLRVLTRNARSATVAACTRPRPREVSTEGGDRPVQRARNLMRWLPIPSFQQRLRGLPERAVGYRPSGGRGAVCHACRRLPRRHRGQSLQ